MKWYGALAAIGLAVGTGPSSQDTAKTVFKHASPSVVIVVAVEGYGQDVPQSRLPLLAQQQERD